MRTKVEGRFSMLLLAFAVVVLIAALAMGLAVKAEAQTAPTIQSDKEDYPPGALVTLTGSGWQPNETVNVYVNDDVGKTWERTVDVTADASGNITDQFNLPDWFVATYQVRATGAQSGLATTSFTDGTVSVKAVGTGGLAAPIEWRLYDGTTCSGSVVRSGSIPGGASASGNGSTIPGEDVKATQSVRLTAGAVSGYAFSSWTPAARFTTGNFTPTSNPGCLMGSGGTQNVEVNYTQGVTTRTTTTSLSSNPNPSTYGQAVTFTAMVSPNPSGVGTVTFKRGTDILCANVAPGGNGAATCSVSNLAAGNHNITAEYSGGTGYTASTSPALAQAVNKAQATLTLSNLTGHIYDGTAKAATVSTSPTGLNGASIRYSQDGNPVASPTNAGEYLATATLDNPNYQANNVTGPLKVDKANQRIAFDALPDRAFDDPRTFDIRATASSGLPVSFAASGNCTVSGSTVNVAGAGSCTITASQTGNGNYSAADPVPQSFTIGKGSQSITFAGPASMTYGDTPFDPDARATSGGALTYNIPSTTDVCAVDSATNKVRILSAGTCTVSATQAGNADYEQVTETRNIIVNKKELTGSFTAANKTYDGTADATITGRSVAGKVGNDDVSLTGGAATFDNKNVGTAKTVTLTGAALSGNQANNYTLGSVSATTADIDRKELTGSFTAANKTYDGTTAATIATSDLNGIVGTDDVKLNGNEATFEDKNAGTGKTVTVNRGDLSGAQAGNYTLAAGPWTTTANITPKPVSGGFSAADKTYDGAAAATITGRNLNDSDVVAGDAVSLIGGSASFDNANVGQSKTVTGTSFSLSGTDAKNYNLGSVGNATASITAKELSVSFTAADKEYNGNANATITGSSITDGVVGGDGVGISHQGATASFADANAGQNKTVTGRGFTLTGAAAGNYSLPDTLTTTADITPVNLTINGAVAQDKTYDGSANAAVNFDGASLVGVVGDDDVTIDSSGYEAEFANADVGQGKPVTVRGVELGGTGAGNYTVSQSGGLTANITAKNLTIEGAVAQDKTYDGSTDAAVRFGGATLVGVVGTENVTIDSSGYSASFDNKNVGRDKAVTVIGVKLGGTGADNYTVSQPSGLTANITAKSVTGSFSAADKTYDGDVTATVTDRALSGVVSGDTVSLTGGTASFADKNVGTAKTVTLTGATLSGDQANNYTLDSVSTTTANIEKRPVTVNIATADKTYDGRPGATITNCTLDSASGNSGKLAGDDVGCSASNAAFGTAAADAGKTVTANVSLTGSEAGNYRLTSSTASTTANITRIQLTPSVTVENKTYDGTTSATIKTRGFANPGAILSGEQVTLEGGTAEFETAAAATGKQANVTDLRLGGAGADNYALSSTSTTAQADIDRKELAGSFTAANKTYDGTTAATIAGRSVAGKVGSDNVSLTGGTATFGTAAAGTDKTVTGTGFTLAGAAAENYKLASTMLTVSANIDKRSVTATITAANKTLDGTTAATITNCTLDSASGNSGKLAGDDVGCSASNAQFGTAGVGPSKQVTATVSLTGSAADNYRLTSGTASTTANITYKWDGFRSPVDNPGTGATPVFNSAKAGQSIPMKFSLSGNQGLGVIAAGYPKVTSVNCVSSATVDPLEAYAASTANGGLNYDSSIDQYNYVWKTQSTYAGKCYKFDMQLIDGTSHVAYFKFIK